MLGAIRASFATDELVGMNLSALGAAFVPVAAELVSALGWFGEVEEEAERKRIEAAGGPGGRRRRVRVKGALQLLINRYGSIRLAHVLERVTTKSFVVLMIGNSKSFHLGAQGTFDLNPMEEERIYRTAR